MDAKTYTGILLENRDRIYTRALYILRDADEAADVTQDVFLRLWRAREGVDAAKVDGWLSRVVHNRCIDTIRRRKVVAAHLGRGDTEVAERLPAPESLHTDPELGLTLERRRERLLDAMAGLSPETRSVMMMHYFEGMKLREIADALGKTVSALKVQIHRARKALRDVLEAEAACAPAARRETG
jgi:RNA polymerase sigma-70 factor (ECF subfamily)